MYGKEKVVKAVDGVEIEIFENEIYGLAGESGCGKSTLLKTLLGLVEPPLRLIDGNLYYNLDGKTYDFYSLSIKEKKKFKWSFVSYVPQGSMSVLNPVTKVKETFNDFLKTYLKRNDKGKYYEMIKEHLIKLGLPENILNAYPHQLSGGMRQRVTIALSTILNPKVIIADEPTTALDVVTQRGVLQLLKDIQKSFKNTLVIVTHDMGVHANIATRIGVMYAGKIIEEAPTTKIFSEPKHPYTQFLIYALPKFGDRSRKTSAPGNPPSLSDLPSGCSFHPRCPYALEKCRVLAPELKHYSNDHRVACWLMEED